MPASLTTFPPSLETRPFYVRSLSAARAPVGSYDAHAAAVGGVAPSAPTSSSSEAPAQAPQAQQEGPQQQQEGPQEEPQQQQEEPQQQEHDKAPAAPPTGLLFAFGGCVDTGSSFPFLARSYAQTQELWVADLAQLAWVGPLTRLEEGDSGWPAERMAHTFTPLPRGRVLLLGGRWREGIRSDAWCLQLVSGARTDRPACGRDCLPMSTHPDYALLCPLHTTCSRPSCRRRRRCRRPASRLPRRLHGACVQLRRRGPVRAI